MKNRLRSFLVILAVLGLMGSKAFALGSYDASSGNDPWALFQLMINVGSEIWFVIKIALLISGVIGLIFIVIGLQKIRAHASDSQGAGHLKTGIVLVILGGLLFGVPILTMLVGNSLFGSAPAPVTTQENVNCQMVSGQYQAGCGLTCPGNAIVGQGGACQACGANEYASGNTCTTCDGVYGSNPNCKCSGYVTNNGGCASSCPQGTIIDPENNTCVAPSNCPSDAPWDNNGTCSNCTGEYIYPNGECETSCSDPNMTINSNSNFCTCNASYYWDESNGGCITQAQCVSPNVIDGNTCATGCPPPSILGAGNTCVCPTGSFMDNNSCASCPQGQYVNPAGNGCISSCPPGSYGNPSLLACVSQCDAGGQYPDADPLTHMCVLTCSSAGTYPDSATRVCESCNTNNEQEVDSVQSGVCYQYLLFSLAGLPFPPLYGCQMKQESDNQSHIVCTCGQGGKSIDYSLDQPPYSSMVNNVPYFVAGDVSTFIAKIESMCS